MMRGWLPVLSVAIVLSACTQWPSEGTGGLAERSPVQHPRVHDLGGRYVKAVRNGAKSFAAAETVEAELLLTRVSREYSAGLESSAEGDAAALEELLSRIEGRIRAAHVHSGRG
jgi:hypothetical protein